MLKKKKLLVVDDEKDICSFIKIFFRKKGFLVYSALSGGQALSLAKKIRPNIALIDIHLKKGLSGLDVLREIKRSVIGCRCIMVTWDKAQEKMKEARKLGALSYLAKPLTTAQLFKVVCRAAKNSGNGGSKIDG